MAFQVPTPGEVLGVATGVSGAAAFIAAPPAAVVEFATAARLHDQAAALHYSGEAANVIANGGVFFGFDPGLLADMATKAVEVHSTSAWALAISGALGMVAFVGSLAGLNRGNFR